MLTDEQRVMLADIDSLLQQIKSVEAGEQETTEDLEVDDKVIDSQPIVEEEEDKKVQMTADEEDEIISKAAEILKARKSADGVTADDDAETRLHGDEPDQNNQAVVKSLAKMQKDMVKMATVMKSIFDNQKDTSTAVENILEGIGVTENVLKSQGDNLDIFSQRHKPVLTRQNKSHMIQKSIEEKNGKVQKDLDSIANESNLSDVLGMLFG